MTSALPGTGLGVCVWLQKASPRAKLAATACYFTNVLAQPHPEWLEHILLISLNSTDEAWANSSLFWMMSAAAGLNVSLADVQLLLVSTRQWYSRDVGPSQLCLLESACSGMVSLQVIADLRRNFVLWPCRVALSKAPCG